MKIDVYEKVTNEIIEALEKGVLPWEMPWFTPDRGGGLKNFASKTGYRGINVFLLGLAMMKGGFSSPYFATFNQIKNMGGNVKKGAKGQAVVFWKMLEKSTGRTNSKGEPEVNEIPLLRYYTVFNYEQAEGIALPKALAPVERSLDWDPLAEAEKIRDGYRNRPDIREMETRAYYSPSRDLINIPKREMFKTREGYYATLFHEMAHSTGHKDRLNREGIVDAHFFGDEVYSKEELIAEMGSAFLCARAGIAASTRDNHAAYIKGWLKALKNDPKMVVQAAGKAQKAADLILGENK